ncbi:MAG TPA: LPS assembly protein LptD [Verrucomicrobiae bacterium]
MRKLLWLVLTVLALGMVQVGYAAESATTNWEFESLTDKGEFSYDLANGIASTEKGGRVKRGPTILTANRLSLNQKTGWATAEGAVVLEHEGAMWRGEKLEYNFLTKQLKAEEFRTGYNPFYASGFSLAGDGTNEVYTAYYGTLTTDDVEDPGYKIKAKSLTIVPGKYIEAKSATVYLGDVPVFYWPYYKRHLDRHPNNIVLTPGYRSLYGPYMLTTYNWYGNTNLDGSVHVDYRQKRGVGGGPDFKYNLGKFGIGEFKYYATRDEDARLNAINQPLSDFRDRISFNHQLNLRTNFFAQASVRYQSDEFMIRDFFEEEYEKNIQPITFLETGYFWRNFSLSAYAQPQVNDFFDTVERLPEIKLAGMRQQLGDLPLYYETESTAGYYRRQFGHNLFNEFQASRADTYHQITLPQTYFGWLNFTPRAGGRFTHYSETDGFGSTLEEENRGVFNTGAEVSFKVSRLWKESQNKFFQVDGLRHIMEPSINYVYVPTPNAEPRELPQFDYLQPSFELTPIDFPDFNSVDSIDAQNVFRFGWRNKLQTKREGQLENLVNWALYTDWRLNPRNGQGTFADLFSDLDLKPRNWLVLNSELRYSLDNGWFRQAYHTATFKPGSRWSLSLGHRYLRDDPVLFGPNSGHNLLSSVLYYRLNENWAARISHHFEARDGQLEEQYYTLYRDMRSWTTALTFRVRQGRFGQEDDYTIAVTFSLKAFPRFGLGSDDVSPSYLIGG